MTDRLSPSEVVEARSTGTVGLSRAKLKNRLALAQKLIAEREEDVDKLRKELSDEKYYRTMETSRADHADRRFEGGRENFRKLGESAQTLAHFILRNVSDREFYREAPAGPRQRSSRFNPHLLASDIRAAFPKSTQRAEDARRRLKPKAKKSDG